jgi:hypothetical protein
MIDAEGPQGDENIIVIPGSSLRGVLGKLAYVENLRRRKIINPAKVIVVTGDRDLSEPLDSSLNLYLVDSVKTMLDNGQPFKDLENFLSQNYKKKPFSDLTSSINECYDKNHKESHEIIKTFEGDRDKFRPLNETGGSLYLIIKLGLDQNMYCVTHTQKYSDGSRPDTESTAKTLSSHLNKNILENSKEKKIGIVTFQPYIKRQTEIFEFGISSNTNEENLDISAFGPKYNFWEPRRAMSEFAGFVFERAKRLFKPQDIEHLKFTHSERNNVNISDMPPLYNDNFMNPS